MRFLKQTLLDFTQGNCWSTCIACLLDLDISDVPNFCALGSDTFDGGCRLDWYRRTALWLADRGYGLVTLNFPTSDASGIILPDCAAIIAGPSPRHPSALHAVVGRIESRYVQMPVASEAGLGVTGASFTGWGHSFTVHLQHDPHPSDVFFGDAGPTELNLLVRLMS